MFPAPVEVWAFRKRELCFTRKTELLISTDTMLAPYSLVFGRLFTKRKKAEGAMHILLWLSRLPLLSSKTIWKVTESYDFGAGCVWVWETTGGFSRFRGRALTN